MAFVVPSCEDGSKIFGNVAQHSTSAMAKCACVACNRCTCACSCRAVETFEEDFWD